MSYKIEIQNNFFVVTDTATGIEEIREVRDEVKWRVSGSLYSFFYNIPNLVDQNSPNIIRLGENAKEFDFSEIVDSTETPFASRAIFNTLLNENLGFIIRETSSVWGLITGDINDQTDLQTILNGKFDVPTGDTTQYIAGDGTLITFPVAGQAGTLVREVKNTTGATLTKGTIVYINGANGNKPTIAKALATSDATSAQTFGFLQSDIPNNSVGFAVAVGDLTGLDTSAITEGTQLYLSSTVAGEYTTTKQVAPAHLVYVGIVTRSHPTLGQIEVKIQNGYELDELHDVLISGETDGQVLQFEGASGLWKNKTLATGLTVGSTAISSGTNGRILFQNANVLQQSASLFWDNTNGRFGIGTSTPSYALDVFGASRIRSLTGLDANLTIEANVSNYYALLNIKSGDGINWGIGTCQYQYANALIVRSGASGTEKLAIFSNGNVNVNSTTDLGAKFNILAQGALSTDLAFKVRNSANTFDIIRANGAGEVFIGLGAGNVNTGANNNFIGVSSGLVNTTGANNVGLGLQTLKANTTGQENVAISVNALLSNTTANYNIAIGINSVRTNTTGSANGGIGVNSLYSNTTGSNNTAYGYGSLQSNTTGNSNVAIGVNALQSNTTGSNNLAFGQSAGRYIANGVTQTTILNNSIFIGYDSKASADNETNQIVIGHGSVGLGSNTAVIGNSSTTLFRPYGNVAIGADTAGARLDVRAQGALSTDIALRVRNSANTGDLFNVQGNGITNVISLVSSGGVYVNNSSNALLQINSGGGINPKLDFTTANSGTATSCGYMQGDGNGWLRLMGGTKLNIGTGTNFAMSIFSNLNVSVNTSSDLGAKFGILSQGALSTDIVFKVRNSANTADTFVIQGNGVTGLNTLVATNAINITQPAGAYYPAINFTANGTQVCGQFQGYNGGMMLQNASYFNIQPANVYIGAYNTGVASAVLTVNSTTKGFLPPRMTNAQRTAIATPAVGLMVYCTDSTEGLYIYKSTGWTFVI